MCAYVPKTSLFFWQIFLQNNLIGCFFSPKQGRDLAILSACNATILSYGTYGFWGGFLAGRGNGIRCEKIQKNKLSEVNSKRCRALESFMAISLVRGQKAPKQPNQLALYWKQSRVKLKKGNISVDVATERLGPQVVISKRKITTPHPKHTESILK